MRSASSHSSSNPSLSRRKVYSQNFLRNPTALEKFIAHLPSPALYPAVEVGAGDGALTSAISELFPQVTAYEIDRDMVARLRRRGIPPNVDVVAADFLTVDPPEHPFHLVGNVPFGITAEVVGWALKSRSLETATLITEWAYARKRSGDYGRWTRLTVTSWPRIKWSLGGKIGRRSFRPVPSVDAGILKLARQTPHLVNDDNLRAWQSFVQLGFSGIGGSLFRSLTTRFDTRAVRAAFRQCKIDESTVVAFVHPDDWLSLYAHLRPGK